MVSLFDALIPNSPSDYLGILVWVLIMVLVVIISVDVFMFLSYRRSSQKKEEQPQIVNPMEQPPQVTDDKASEMNDIRIKVDQLLQAHKL